MSEDVYVQFINGTIVESAAGTLTEQEILTGCTIAGMVKDEAISMELREIICEFEPPFPQDSPSAGDTEFVQFVLSTESGLSAIPHIDDIHCIYVCEIDVRAGVATYLPLVSKYNAYPPVYQFVHPVLIPHPKIYAYVQSSNSSTAHRVYYRIGFTYVRLTGPEVMEALEVWRSPTA